jgi:hypothetical protein
MECRNSWIVYACHNDVDLLYIGHGKIGREKHVNSGTSHVYELNRDHFIYNNLKTVVLKYFDTKNEASEYEEYLIRKCLPKYNKMVKDAEQKVSNSFGWLDNVHKVKKKLDLLFEIVNNTNSFKLKGNTL